MTVLNHTVENALDFLAATVATNFKADLFSYLGGIRADYLTEFRESMENLASKNNEQKNLVFLLHTGGGVAEIVENMVQITRHHYNEVWFLVPDLAMSAGTILCMSGDKIFMDYSSALGPIDPQVQNSEGQLVPALGYLDQVKQMIDKSANNALTDAEFAILQNQDLATLQRYEQAKELSISLLKDWLVKYKFKDWNLHASKQTPVTEEDKIERAGEIASELSDHKRWHSHGRMIGMNTLTAQLNLKIEDYTADLPRRLAVRQYSDLLIDCLKNRRVDHLFHAISLAEAKDYFVE